MSDKKREATLFEALIPIFFLIAFLSANVSVFGDSALDGSNQIVLILSAAVAGLMAVRIGFSWKEIQKGMTESINAAMPSILILLMIGAVAGSWLVSGVVPAMIYYGLMILNPSIFLFAACAVCAIVSMATGSSWTTAATVGIALMGIGQTMGIHEGVVAGAIISGAYFGDKMSPLSDTTNLAPAMAGTDLFTHIRYMTYTTFPSMGICLLIFLVIGLAGEYESAETGTASVLQAIESKFNISIWLFVVPTVVVFLIVRKTPALPALLVGTLLAVVFALVFQPAVLTTVSGMEITNWRSLFIGSMKSLYGSVGISTSNAMVNDLLSSDGMYGMLKTIWLILSAMLFGGIMEKAGLLRVVVNAIIGGLKQAGSVIAATTGTCIFFNITASDQYLAIVVPGRMFAPVFAEKGLAPQNLSRTLEDSGTVTSVLVPWNTCGAYHANVLGVGTLTYAPYCFFNLISPIMTIVFGYLRIKIAHLVQEKKED